jgi:hypothetical protein
MHSKHLLEVFLCELVRVVFDEKSIFLILHFFFKPCDLLGSLPHCFVLLELDVELYVFSCIDISAYP